MGFTCLPYLLATGGAVTDTAMVAVTDPEFSNRSSHFIFTEQYKLKCHLFMGANGTRCNIDVPTWNAISKQNVWPIALSSANVLSPPRVSWLADVNPLIPVNEEYIPRATDTASENAVYVMWPFTPGHDRNIPGNKAIITVRATASITQVANGWSTAASLTFESNLRGGIYSIIGAEVVGAASLLFRLIFPRSRLYRGRRLRPGWLCQQAIGDLPDTRFLIDPYYFGEWGRFHTFEPPQIEVYTAAASSTVTHEIRLYLAFLGESGQEQLDPWVSQGWT